MSQNNVFAVSERARSTPPTLHAVFKMAGVPLEIHRLPPVKYIVENVEALPTDAGSRVSGDCARVLADDSLYVRGFKSTTAEAKAHYEWIKLEGARLEEARNHGREWAVVLAAVGCTFPSSWTPYELEDVVLGSFETEQRAHEFLGALVALGARFAEDQGIRAQLAEDQGIRAHLGADTRCARCAGAVVPGSMLCRGCLSLPKEAP